MQVNPELEELKKQQKQKLTKFYENKLENYKTQLSEQTN